MSAAPTPAEIKSIIALLPKGNVFDPVYEVISESASERGAVAARIEPEFSTQNRLGQICSQLEKADLIVADLSSRNPHVMYGAGYAHGVGKRVLFLTSHGEDFPFDKDRHPIIIYAGNLDFLRNELSKYLHTGKTASAPPESASSNGREKFAQIFGDILKQHHHEHRGEIEMENAKTFVLLNQDMDLALVQDLSRKARELGFRIKLM